MKHVELKNRDGNILRGYYTKGKAHSGHLVVMFHGFTGNKTEHEGHFRNFSRLLAQEGIGSLRLDFFGNGESDGEFSEFTFHTLMMDAEDIVEYAKKIEGVKFIHLLGFSMGGATAAYFASHHIEEVSSLVLWSPAGNICNKIQHYFATSPKLENGHAVLGTFELSEALADSVKKYDMYEGVEQFKKRVCVIHGKRDLAVPYEFGEKYAKNFVNAEWILIEDAGHGYDEVLSKQQLYRDTMQFLKNVFKEID